MDQSVEIPQPPRWERFKKALPKALIDACPFSSLFAKSETRDSLYNLHAGFNRQFSPEARALILGRYGGVAERAFGAFLKWGTAVVDAVSLYKAGEFMITGGGDHRATLGAGVVLASDILMKGIMQGGMMRDTTWREFSGGIKPKG